MGQMLAEVAGVGVCQLVKRDRIPVLLRQVDERLREGEFVGRRVTPEQDDASPIGLLGRPRQEVLVYRAHSVCPFLHCALIIAQCVQLHGIAPRSASLLGPGGPDSAGIDSQYVSPLLSKTMREHGIRPSMDSISSPWDNAAMESLMDLVSRRACTGLCHARRGGAGSVRVHRGHIQLGQDAYDAGRSGPRRVRKGQSAGRRKPSEGGAEGVNGIGADSDSWSWSSSSFSRLEASSRARPRAAPGRSPPSSPAAPRLDVGVH